MIMRVASTSRLLLVAFSLVATLANAQSTGARAIRIAERFQAEARVMHVLDRQGRVLRAVGDRAVYGNVSVSHDGTRIAVIRVDLEAETHDLWVLDLTSGSTTRLTVSTKDAEQRTQLPVWSPDGRKVAYVGLRGGFWGLYRIASDGTGEEELLYRHPGADLQLTDWSLDGRYLIFANSDLAVVSSKVVHWAALRKREHGG